MFTDTKRLSICAVLSKKKKGFMYYKRSSGLYQVLKLGKYNLKLKGPYYGKNLHSVLDTYFSTVAERCKPILQSLRQIYILENKFTFKKQIYI